MLVADQAETSAGGVVTPAVRESLIALAAKYPEKIFLADSRRRVHLFRNVMVKPNHSEAEAACKELFGDVSISSGCAKPGSQGALSDARPQGRAGLRRRQRNVVQAAAGGETRGHLRRRAIALPRERR